MSEMKIREQGCSLGCFSGIRALKRVNASEDCALSSERAQSNVSMESIRPKGNIKESRKWLIRTKHPKLIPCSVSW